jgi:hypothetical protein
MPDACFVMPDTVIVMTVAYFVTPVAYFVTPDTYFGLLIVIFVQVVACFGLGFTVFV